MSINKPVTDKELSAYAEAKAKLSVRIARLKTIRARAVRVNNRAAVSSLDKMLADGVALQAKAATLDKLMAPFIKGWQWVKGKVGLDGMGSLGAFFIPVLAAGGIVAFVIAVKTWGDNTETLAEQLDAQNRARERLIEQGEDPNKAQGIVDAQAGRHRDENVNKKGILANLLGINPLYFIAAAIVAYILLGKKKGGQA